MLLHNFGKGVFLEQALVIKVLPVFQSNKFGHKPSISHRSISNLQKLLLSQVWLGTEGVFFFDWLTLWNISFS